jgi:O-antigen ligase
MMAICFVLPLAHVPALRAVLTLAATLWVGGLLLRERRIPPLARLMAAWIILGVASALWSLDAQGTLHGVFYNMVLPAGVFFAAWRVALEEKGAVRLSWSIVASAMPLAAMVALAAGTGRLSLLQPESGVAGVLRYWPGVGVASTFACLIAPFALLLVACARRGDKALGAALLLALLGIAAATLNRAAWPALLLTAASFVAWLWPGLRLPARRVALGALLAAAAAGWGALQLATSERSPGAAEAIELAHDSRLQGWREWIGIAAQAPLLGHGFGGSALQTAGREALSASLKKRDPNFQSHGHNLLLDVTVQLGLLGLAVFLALLASLLHDFWRLGGRQARGEARLLGAAGTALLVAMLAKNATDDFMAQAMLIAFWGYAGVVLGALEARASGTRP